VSTGGVKIYNTMGEMRRRIAGRECACHQPKLAREVAERVASRLPPRRRILADQAMPHRPPEVEPVILTAGKGSMCRPFLKVEKDAEKFAACNALAEEIGPINTPKKAYRLIEDAIVDEVNEVFGLVTLDLHLRLKSIAETGRGEATAVMAPMVPTLQAALIDGAHAVILMHVHPSGIEAEPSDADKETTEAFAEAFDAVGVILLDHLIAAGDRKNRSYFSFAEEGLL
jgi:DNA repair protein RadC